MLLKRVHMKKYLQLARVRQYIKNGLIFIPAFFEGTFFEREILLKLLAGFFAFSAVCSVVYIFNDWKDAEKDRLHPVKCSRPIASGAVGKRQALLFAAGLLIMGYLILFLIQERGNGYAHLYLSIYFLVNICYSMGMKNVPVLDIMILASGFLLRILYGAALCDTWVSNWLYLTVLMISLYMGTGKRRGEKAKENGDETRKVLRFYSVMYLEKVMQMSMILAVTFYSLWSANLADINPGASAMIWTVPLVLAIIMRYEMLAEVDEDGDPTEIILSDRPLQILTVAYGMIGVGLLYRSI